ncbi:MAG: ABC transporter ATP-binding protein [Kouleothrix sp.]|nr:ABC transporter ATP-binding protein [Kouleothrix sp.]
MNRSLSEYQGLLGRYLRPQRARVILLAALLLGSIGLQLLSPQIIRAFIDTTQAGGAGDTLLIAAGIFIAAGLAQRVVALATLYVGENVGWNATNALRADLARHCLRLDMAFHKRRTPGELIERIDGDVTALGNFFSQFVIRLAGNALLIVAILLLLLREDWRVGLGLMLYTVVTFLALGAVQSLAVSRWEAQRQTSAEHFGFIEERISGTEDIRASGAESYIMARLYGLIGALLRSDRAAWLASNWTFVTMNFLFVLGYAFGLGLGAYLYSQGDVSIGTAYVIVFYIGMLSAPLEHIRTQVEDLQQASASLNRVQELFRIQPQVREAPRAALPAGALEVAFEAVSFGYEDELGAGNLGLGARDVALGAWSQECEGRAAEDAVRDIEVPSPKPQAPSVLDDISFTLAPGTVLGLLGRTGSGKTTLTRLIFRLYDPARGAICLDGTDIRDVALADLRGRVGMVTQDVQLFQASVRDNLALFNKRITDAQIERALGELGLWEWAQALPEGLDTRLAAGGLGLSAGEAQLLAFTRVFLKDPGLIILDEASSRLDPVTERLLERAIDRLLAGRTGIIIAHRLRTVQRADEIMILDRGRVAEHGRRALLADDPGSRFYGLLQTGLEEALA